MLDLGRYWRSAEPHLLSLLRIVASLLLLQHGLQKAIGFPSAFPRPIEFLSLIWFAGAIEVVGGALLLIGLLSRPTAFLLAGHLAFVYWIGHAPRSFFPHLNGGSLAVLYCFVFLYLSAAGPGPWSIDRLLGGRAAASNAGA